ncbi:23S rRNA (adenine(2503)-C(2))-methyltransferase RlmN [Oceanispirochaeta sp. M2]|nr:23S rRNA (adenine(2503)-C(2))-methyltransferase RlmN [Oceanispirochaeta sp. M2]NPD75292.1 23S rRNA (adenine(2503)-C(2))-methyltransferase RlmN [Oceanispirochaeta sp. M1]RDG28860.1 23S rRNA (adenine(2503)-C(2))-methyltransferase RlmN [Oceanispirochaeta sp. M1]
MTALLGQSLEDIKEICSSLGMPKFTAAQITDWLYKKRVSSIEEMTNLSKKNRELLESDYYVGRTEPVDQQKSTDGTIKYLFSVENNLHIEAVYIPDNDRATLCISSQVGCKRSCSFCMTGKQGLQGQLSSAEILNQIFSLPEFETLSNVVYMGMGEPLDNLEAVMKSLEVLTAEWGLAWSPKRVTLSTIGIVPALEQFLERSQVHLAVSMHDPFADERESFMPVQKVYPIANVIKTLKRYDFSKQRRVSFEYILFKGINDSREHADEVVRLVNGLKCRLNLIRFHSFPGAPFDGSDDQAIFKFQDRLKAKGITCTVRASRGQDILAACGMLSTEKNKE